MVGTLRFQARYWYDGTFVNNAREDAAEVALHRLSSGSAADAASSSFSRGCGGGGLVGSGSGNGRARRSPGSAVRASDGPALACRVTPGGASAAAAGDDEADGSAEDNAYREVPASGSGSGL